MVATARGVFILGGNAAGWGEPVRALASVERLIIDGPAMRGEPAGALCVPRSAPRAAPLPDGRILVVGGEVERSATTRTNTTTCEIYDPATRTSAPAAPTGRFRRGGALLVLPGAGGLLFVGGWVGIPGHDGASVAVADVSRFDPASGAWSEERPLRKPYRESAAVVLRDGSVLVSGGFRGVTSRNENTFTCTNDVERRDPAGVWHAGEKPMIDARHRHRATLLADGRVLVSGGYCPALNAADRSEVFDPLEDEGGAWTACGSMVRGESGHDVILLDDGRVLIAGEFGNAQVFDPARLRWTEAGEVPGSPRAGTSMASPGGRALLVGGVAAGSPRQSLGSCLLWTPRAMEPVSEGPEPLPACPACEAALDASRVAMVRGWMVSISCRRCLSVVRFAWPGENPVPEVEVTGAFVDRLRDRLARAAEEGPVTAYREVMKVFREPTGWLLGVPEVFAAARRGVVAMKLSADCSRFTAERAGFPIVPDELRKSPAGAFRKDARFRVVGVRDHKFLVVPEHPENPAVAGPILCSLDLLLPADRVL